MNRKWAAGVAVLMTVLAVSGCASDNKAADTSSEVSAVQEETALIAEDAQEADSGAEKVTGSDASDGKETGAAEEEQDKAAAENRKEVLPDAVYQADFDTDSSMFHVSEACDGKGTLTVVNGEMTIHVSLQSKKILNLYCGLAEDAQKEGAELLNPTTDTVTYSDGMTEEVYGFDIPVPAIGEEFDLALVGTKGTWYDHKVVVSNPVLIEGVQLEEAQELEDGIYTIEHTFEGGSGKAQIQSPVTITVENQVMTAKLVWSSPNYDYMLVAGEKYLPVNTDGNSVFEIPVSNLDEPLDVIGDTVAMSTPHEIEYTITFHTDTLKKAD